MKKYLLASAAAVLLSAGAAQADSYMPDLPNSYVSILGGSTFAPDLNVGGTTHRMNTGFNVGGRFGYYLSDWNLPNVSVEADGLFNQSYYSHTNSTARLQSSSYMGNLIYHLHTGMPFEIYGGGGLGAVNTNVDNGIGNHGGSTVLGWQALGGVSYPVSDHASLFAEYRYQNAHDVNAGGLTQIGNTSNNLSVGMKWNLD
jgi:opacity protein-like surface antigen